MAFSQCMSLDADYEINYFSIPLGHEKKSSKIYLKPPILKRYCDQLFDDESYKK